MSKVYQIESLTSIAPDETYLVLINPERIPHLVLVHQSFYYTLTYNDCIRKEPFGPYLEKLKRAGKKILMLQITHLVADPDEVFQNYQKAKDGEITCLEPIKRTLLPEINVEFVFELIPHLYENEMIVKSLGFNLENLLTNGNEFELNQYTKASIYAYISALNRNYDTRRKNRLETH